MTEWEKEDCLYCKSEAREPYKWVYPTWSESSQLRPKHSKRLQLSFSKFYPVFAHLSRISELHKCIHSEHIKSLLCQAKSTWTLLSICDWEMTRSTHTLHPASGLDHVQLVWSPDWRNKVYCATLSGRTRGFFLRFCPQRAKFLNNSPQNLSVREVCRQLITHELPRTSSSLPILHHSSQ